MPGKGPVKPIAKRFSIQDAPSHPQSVGDPECHLVARPGQLTKQEVEATWKDLTLTRLVYISI